MQIKMDGLTTQERLHRKRRKTRLSCIEPRVRPIGLHSHSSQAAAEHTACWLTSECALLWHRFLKGSSAGIACQHRHGMRTENARMAAPVLFCQLMVTAPADRFWNIEGSDRTHHS